MDPKLRKLSRIVAQVTQLVFTLALSITTHQWDDLAEALRTVSTLCDQGAELADAVAGRIARPQE